MILENTVINEFKCFNSNYFYVEIRFLFQIEHLKSFAFDIERRESS